MTKIKKYYDGSMFSGRPNYVFFIVSLDLKRAAVRYSNANSVQLHSLEVLGHGANGHLAAMENSRSLEHLNYALEEMMVMAYQIIVSGKNLFKQHTGPSQASGKHVILRLDQEQSTSLNAELSNSESLPEETPGKPSFVFVVRLS